MEKTYCNPLMIEGLTSGKKLDTTYCKDFINEGDYRSIAEPTVVYHDGKWIMYTSYHLAYITEDFVHWKPIDIGLDSFDVRYAPTVIEFRGKWYIAGHTANVFVSDSPTGPFALCGHYSDCKGNPTTCNDGTYFLDDDGRLYLYWFTAFRDGKTDADLVSGTLGAEMNPEKPWQMLTEPVEINRYDPDIVWQRHGDSNENKRISYLEGPLVKKYGGRYYLMCNAGGTQFTSYAKGVYYSDEGPLGGFKMQKRALLSEKRQGLLRGAGHGCLVEGPNNTLWNFYITFFSYHHRYERRISMDPVGIDENGELYCRQVTETPQYAPGVLEHPEINNDAGLVPLTFYTAPVASSAESGREAVYASDDSVITWWQPKSDDKEPCITFRFNSGSKFDISSFRIIWRDIGMDTDNGINPGAFQYVVEYAEDSELTKWKPLVDASENKTDLCIDYRQFETVAACGARLKILGSPEGITPGLVSFTVFGK